MPKKPLPPEAEIGRTFSHRPSTTMQTTPETTSGITVAVNPAIERIRSAGLPNLSAAKTPPMIASGTTITNASAASSSECTSAVPRIGPTGAWYWVELPKLPWSR